MEIKKPGVLHSNLLKQIVVTILCISITFNLPANPTGGNVTAGNIIIKNSPKQTQINQTSKKGIIRWQTFNIDKNELTHFQQPRGGITLNKINSANGMSKIFGTLTATGKIILSNGAGIYFGPGSYVNVGGLIATTADMTDENFLSSDRYQFIKNSSHAGSIINEGTIVARENGLVALVAPGVENNGVIQANLGHIILASGEAFTVDFAGDNLINFRIDAETTQTGIDHNGKKLSNGVTNNGVLLANGGTVLLTGKAASGILDHIINMNGIVEAKSVREHNGEIILSAAGDDIVRVNGTLNASGEETGGKIKVLGNKVLIDNDAVLNASGKKGGGEILIGGDYQGKNPNVQNADYVYVNKKANIYADALEKGDGGKVILWSDLGTKFYGNIFARGGAEGGNGGFVEVSSKDLLAFAGNVNVRAPKGKVGSLLLDPTNLYIVDGAQGSGDQDNAVSTGNGSLFFSDPDETDNTISVGQLQALGDIDITLQASNQLTIGSIGGGSTQLDLSGTLFSGILSLIAGDSTTVGGGHIVFNSGSALSTGGGSVRLTAGNVTQATGSATLGSITTNGGDLTVTAQQGITAHEAIDVSTGAINLDGGNGLVTINNNLSSIDNVINVTGNGITQGANAIVNAGFGVLSYDAGNQTITTNSGSQLLSAGVISLNAANMNLSASGVIGGDGFGMNANNVIFTAPSGATIGVAGGAGSLSLTTAMLNTVRATNVRIGDSNAGNISLGGFTPSSTFAQNGVFTLATAGTITQTGALVLANNTGLLLRNASSATLTNTNNAIFNLAASIQGQLTVSNRSDTGLIVTGLADDIGTINGIVAPGGINLTTSGTGGLLRINQNISTSNNAINLTGTRINQAGNTTINAGSGNITMNADSNTLTTGSNSRILSTGSISITGNNLLLSGTQIGGDGSGTHTDHATHVSLQPGSAGMSIGLAGGSGSFNLTTARLNSIRSTNVSIGNSNSGTMRIGAWTPLATFAQNGVLTLNTGGSILQTGALNFATSNSSLLIRSATAATLTNSGNVINNIAASMAGPLSITSTSPITVTSLTDTTGSVSGITSNGLSLSSTGLLNILQSIQANNNAISLTGSDISVAANQSVNSGTGIFTANAGTGILTLNGGSQLLSTGTINLTGNTVAFDSTAQIGGTSLGNGNAATVIVLPSTNGRTIGIAGGAGNLALSASALDTIRTTNLRIGNNNSGAITLGAWTPAAHVAGNGVLTLDSGNTISQTGAINLSLNQAGLLLRDATSVNLNSLDNVLNVIAANTIGPIAIQQSANLDLNVGSLTDDLGTVNGMTTANQPVTLGASGAGNININAGINSGAIQLSAGNTINLNANLNSNNGAMNFNNLVNLLSPVTLNSGAGDMNFAGNLNGTNQTLTINNTTGDVTFNGDVSLGNLITIAQNYGLTFHGDNNTFANAMTLNNTGGVTLGDGNSQFNFNNGLTSTASTTTLNGTINSNNADMTFGSTILAGDSALNTAGGNLTFGAISGGNDLTLNTGSTGNINFNGNAFLDLLHIINTNNLTVANSALLNVSNYLQDAGNLTQFGNSGLNAANDTNITVNSVTGHIQTQSLTLDVNNANIFGTVNGLNDEAAIPFITNVRTIGPGTHFFDGIDMFLGTRQPNPPGSTTPGTPDNTNGLTNQAIAQAESVLRNANLLNQTIPDLSMTMPPEANNANQLTFEGNTLPNSVLATTSGLATAINSNPLLNTVAQETTPTNALLPQLIPSLVRAFDNMTVPQSTALLGALALAMAALLGAIRRPTLIPVAYRREESEEVRSITFELRTILNTIGGFAGLIYNDKVGAATIAQKEYLGDILSDSHSLLAEVNQLSEQGTKMTHKAFLEQLSFKLRTALTGIKGFTEMLYQEKLGVVTAEEKEYLKLMLSSSDDAIALVQ